MADTMEHVPAVPDRENSSDPRTQRLSYHIAHARHTTTPSLRRYCALFKISIATVILCNVGKYQSGATVAQMYGHCMRYQIMLRVRWAVDMANIVRVIVKRAMRA